MLSRAPYWEFTQIVKHKKIPAEAGKFRSQLTGKKVNLC